MTYVSFMLGSQCLMLISTSEVERTSPRSMLLG